MNFPRLQVNDENKVDYMVCGFGYLPSIDKYKIIKIYYIQNQAMGRVQVYTLGGGSCSGWRDIGETAYSLRHDLKKYGFLHQPCPFGTFANGALHWLDNERRIVSFDLADEKLYMLPSPPFVSDSSPANCYRLQVLGGCLCFIHSKLRGSDIWFLRKKGENSSCNLNEQEYGLLTWIKELRLPVSAIPFSVTKSGQFLMWYGSNLCSYDPKTATMEKHVLNGDFCRAVPHMNSFVSLKSLGEKCRSTKKIRR
ncbi:uncharacterized protein LOC113313042 [Papaver somniferum]|uniref:uncharacterized protein LOC113313042 n=1 Tax=Papaver somniferum TaxID=3469 RepID=UPI000E6F53AB|nr:uncharacterized protein LOC113313042 [Papaver somniferum]